MSNFNEWEQMYGELDIIKERRRFLRKRICGLIRKHYVGSSEPKLQRKIKKGYLGDYPDKRLIEISKKIIEGRLKNE